MVATLSLEGVETYMVLLFGSGEAVRKEVLKMY
jgi:hypothetical protein